MQVEQLTSADIQSKQLWTHRFNLKNTNSGLNKLQRLTDRSLEIAMPQTLKQFNYKKRGGGWLIMIWGGYLEVKLYKH